MRLVKPQFEGWSSRSRSRGSAAGCVTRTREALIGDVLTWERELGLNRPRRAGLANDASGS
jgi:2'-hydroxyisoflavone reductase